MKRTIIILIVAALSACLVSPAGAADSPATKPAVVCNVKVLSDKVKDFSSLEAWKKSCIKDTYTEADFVEPIRPYIKSVLESKTIAPDVKKDMLNAIICWQTVSSYQHQGGTPAEFIGEGSLVVDPLKIANVYGTSYCSVAAAEVAALARYLGLKARGWTINRHCVLDVYWGGNGHMLDSSLINFFPKKDGDVASVAEICDAVQGWLKDHPDLKDNDAKLREFHFADGKTGWKKGPELLTNCPFYNVRGWWPAGTHGWYSTMQEYDGGGKEKTPFEYLEGYTAGYSVNIQLRQGEVLTRNWSNKGLHVNGKDFKATKLEVGKDAMVYTPVFGDLAPGRVGNGTLVYQPPIESLFWSAARYDGISGSYKDGPYLHNEDMAKTGVLEIRMPSSYVYLTGKLCFSRVIERQAGEIKLFFSDNNGLDWKEIALPEKDGPLEVDLTDLVLRRYDYRLKFELTGDIGLRGISISHDIQHSQRPLPALAQGDNTITFSAGPQESTMSLEASMNAANKGKNLMFTDFHPELDGIDGQKLTGKSGSMTFPVKTPGDLTRLRLGCNWRTWGPDSGFAIEVSYDDGKTFKPVAPFNGKSDRYDAQYVEVTDIPAGTKAAKVRFIATKKQDLMLLTYHVNADYKQPGAGFRPVKVTYVWDEDGKEKTDVHTATKPQETYTIKCASKPVMKSITMQLE